MFPLFGGKRVDEYNGIIYGHYHFFGKHIKDNIVFYSLNGTKGSDWKTSNVLCFGEY